MKPVLSASMLKAVDQLTIEREGIGSLQLMERASERCAARMLALVDPPGRPFVIVCGPGNNGGDGLAIARLLHAEGRSVEVRLIGPRSRSSPDNQANLQRAQEARVPIHTGLNGAGERPGAVIVDALFGSGLSRPLEGDYAGAVEWINALDRMVVSIDLPSGILEGGGNAAAVPVVKADRTFVLQVPRRAMFMTGTGPCFGEWELVDIGLDPTAIDSAASREGLIEPADVRAMLPERSRFDHKGDHGHALLIAGSSAMTGAAILAARACVRSGVGLCTVHLPSGSADALRVSAPEAMCSLDGDPAVITMFPRIDRATAAGIGPGCGRSTGVEHMVKRAIQDCPAPLVLDADALNALAANPTWMAFLPAGTILTPHPGEFDRMFGKSSDGAERLDRAIDQAQRLRSVIVLKGAYTAICAPSGHVFFNPTGNHGMAKGGSGDVLTGLITGLRAQGLAAINATVVGVYVHGLAGDLAAGDVGADGMTASDLIDHIPAAFMALRKFPYQSP